MQQKSFSAQIGGKTLSAEFTDIAEQASGSVIIRYGDTAILVTAVMGYKDKEMDYFPLSVEFEERFYAAGRILGSRFIRREGRPSDGAILSGRIIDRTIRPLFNNKMRKDVQVVATVLSISEDDPDVLGVIGASLALGTSHIPWKGPASAVRIGKRKGSDEFQINPTYVERNAEDAELDLLVCGKDGTITMVEVGSKEVSEKVLEAAFAEALKHLQEIQAFQDKIIAEIGKTKKEFVPAALNAQIAETFKEFEPDFEASIFSGAPGKESIQAFKDRFMVKIKEILPLELKAADDFLETEIEKLMDKHAIDNKRRVDGRKLDEIRPLFAKAGGISPVLHGSGIFYRGGTHVFSALTLGGPEDTQIVDSIEESETKKRFMHHYNFPPFSVGETGRVGGLNRRMTGHGALAEKALSAVIPAKEIFPYTIRLVSEAFSSNGSTSMASVCASTIALMDGGVPITAPVAGIAMGVIYESPERYAVLTDIQGPEDHYGDMDFKVAGTEHGVTAVQLDVKVEGVPLKVLAEALAQARVARLQILEVMTKEIASPRPDISERAPKIVSLTIPVDMIGLVIGPGGKNIKKIQEETGVTGITLEDDGSIFVTGVGDSPERAADIIRQMTKVWKAGEVAEGPVTRLMNFGAFVNIGGKTEGLVHISEIAPFRIATVEEALQVGDIVKVVVKEIDDQGRVNLSIKMIDPEFATRKNLKASEGMPPPPDRGGYNDRNGGRRNQNSGGGHRW
jgi:polyribonucleotide nucleotidyltransferase